MIQQLVIIFAALAVVGGVALLVEVLKLDGGLSSIRRLVRRNRPARRRAGAGVALIAVGALVLIAPMLAASTGPRGASPSPAPTGTLSGGVKGTTGTPAPSGGPSGSPSGMAAASPSPTRSGSGPTSRPSASPAATHAPTPSPAPTPTATHAPTHTPSPPPTPTPALTPTPTPVASPTPTLKPGQTPYPKPVARIEVNQTCISVADFIRFDGRASSNQTSYLWDFGDGSPTSDRPAPIHEYALIPGTYTVKLTVSGPGGRDTAKVKITIPCP